MVTTTRATSNVPGTTGYRYFGEGEDEHFFVWRGALSRPRMPLLVYCKPGHLFNQGERVMDPHTSSSPGLGVAVDSLYNSHGWPIVSFEFRPPKSADSPKRVPFGHRPWPGPVLSAMKLMLYLRDHWDDESLWGDGGSIDRSRIGFIGSSAGHTMGLLLATIPPGRLPSHTTNGLHQSTLGTWDHRPDAVAGMIGQIDWTQWVLDPDAASGPFKFDVHQYFFDQSSALTYTALSMAIKKSASPWWWLPFVERQRTAFWGSWGSRPGSGNGKNLTPELWLPGTEQRSKVNNRAFTDPHHYFQAQPWHKALSELGCTVRTIWGTNTDNPTGPNNDNVGLDLNTTGADMASFFTNTLRWPAVV